MQTTEYIVQVQRGTSPEADMNREYIPIDAESEGQAENLVLERDPELYAIAVFERVR